MKYFFFILLFSLLSPSNMHAGPDSLTFRGQLSGYTHINPRNSLPWLTGARYIPQINYSFLLQNENKIDFEASLNL